LLRGRSSAAKVEDVVGLLIWGAGCCLRVSHASSPSFGRATCECENRQRTDSRWILPPDSWRPASPPDLTRVWRYIISLRWYAYIDDTFTVRICGVQRATFTVDFVSRTGEEMFLHFKHITCQQTTAW